MSKCVILLAALLVHSSLSSADAFSVSPPVAQCPPLRPCPLLHSSLSSSPSPNVKTTTTRSTLSSSSSSQIDGEFTPPSAKEKALGVLVLLTVPLAWGTYAPVVKYVYEMDPPVPGFVFSTAYYLIASASLLTLMSISSSSTTITDEERPDSSSENESVSLSIQGGVELGSYLFLGNCLQVVGLETVPADRAAFLVQLTTIMVPIFQAAFARDILAISLKTWVACLLAFSGVIIMGFDGKDLSLAAELAAADSTTTSSTVTVLAPLTSSLSAVADTFSGGDVLIILAAVAYTMHVVRLGKYAQSTTPLQLAASKASWEAILSLTLISGLVLVHGGALGDASTIPEFLDKTSGEVTTYLATFGDSLANADTSTLLPAFGACLWTGWVTCAYTIYAQSFGQRRVSPTDANLVRFTNVDVYRKADLVLCHGNIFSLAALMLFAFLKITVLFDASTDLYDAAYIFESLCLIGRNSWKSRNCRWLLDWSGIVVDYGIVVVR